MTDAELDEWMKEVRERCEKATPGPWIHRRCNDDSLIQEVNDSTGWLKDYPFAYIACIGGWGYTQDNNKEFIAASRTDLPRALEIIEGLRAESAKWKDEYFNLCKFTNDFESHVAAEKALRVKYEEALKRIDAGQGNPLHPLSDATSASALMRAAEEALGYEEGEK